MMKNLFYILLVAVAAAACTATKTPDCGQIICTQEFRQVSVTFKDQDGKPVAVNNFKAVIERTGKETAPGDAIPPGSVGIYRVASDSDLRTLSEKGDRIIVTATTPKRMQPSAKHLWLQAAHAPAILPNNRALKRSS